MGFESLYSAVRALWVAAVEVPFSLPTVHDNGPPLGDPRNPHPGPDPATDVWARVSILLGESGVVGNGGGNQVRTPGILKATLFGPLERGDAPILALADQIVAAFLAVASPSYAFGVPSVTIVGASGPWWVVDVDCPFDADEQA